MGRASKDKRDIYYRKAKEEGYRARSAYKLLQIHEEFNILNPSEIRTGAVDLCAAPGSWSQVLAQHFKRIGANTTTAAAAEASQPAQTPRVVAVDLQEMAPIDGVTLLQGDITREATAKEIIRLLNAPVSTGVARADGEQHQKSASSSPASSALSPALGASLRKADIVLCDGAPDVTGMHELDEYLQHHLLLAALHITTFVLRAGGCFLTKMFRGPNTAFLIEKSAPFFQQVRVVKPQSSRNASMESFLLCQCFRMPPGYVPRLVGPPAPVAASSDTTGAKSATARDADCGARLQADNEEDGEGTRDEIPALSDGALRISGFTPEAPSYGYDTAVPLAHASHRDAAAAGRAHGVADRNQRTSCTLAERVLAPFLSCGDLSGFDADMCYDRDAEAGVLDPVQPPLQAPYLAAAAASPSPSAGLTSGSDAEADASQKKKVRVESPMETADRDRSTGGGEQQ